MRTHRKHPLVRGLVAAGTTIGIALTGATAAAAVEPGSSSLVIADYAHMSRVTGGIPASADAPFDVTGGYPAEVPDGYASGRYYPGLILLDAGAGSDPLTMLCIEIRRGTVTGDGYDLSTWNDANIHNAGYIAQILAHDYPDFPGSSDLDDATRVAAIQTAIWFFSDGFVLERGETARPFVEAIVRDALDRGPASEPTAPTVTIDPQGGLDGHTGEALGPFVIGGSADEIAVSSEGGSLWRDREMTEALADGSTVGPGTGVYLVPDPGVTGASVHALGTSEIPSGSAYLYNGVSGSDGGQKLILGKAVHVEAFASAPLTITPLETVTIEKVITGSGAGLQGEILLHVSGSNGLEQDIMIPAGATGTVSTTIDRVPVDTVLTITEPSDGATAAMTVTVSGLGAATVEWNGANVFTITNEYTPVDPPVVPEVPSTVVPPIERPVEPEAPATVQPTLRPVTGALAVTGSSPWAVAGSLTVGGALLASGGALLAAQRRRAA